METATEDTKKEIADTANVSNAASNATIPAPAEPKKPKKDDRNKRDDKNLEQFMKTLNPIPTVDEKLTLVCKKYVQAADEIKKMSFYIKQSDKRHALVVKEKEQLQLEFNKTVLVKSKLENLCRELQKQNKAIKEESLLKIREEEERRKETQAKFQNTLSEITAMLQQNNEKNAKLRDDNISMTEKFKSVVTQYQLREQQVDKMSKQMALENQLAEAKMQKQNLEHQADKERLLSEIEQLKVTVATYRAKMKEFKGVETSLRSQLEVYTDKYEEFQNALVKSNQMFGGFQEQMDKMSKKIKKLEKESLSYKTRWETSQAALLDMCGERQASEERAAASSRQLQHMQSLCRTLQAERTALLGTLKENNIERPPLPPPAPLPAPAPAPSSASAPASNAKVDAMAANCAQLRQSLAHLQTQLNVLTNKQNEEPPKPEPKPEKQEKKKSKSKKNKGEKKAEIIAPKEESDLTDENQTSASENLTQNTDKADETTLETLIQAINNANINLCDLEVVSDEIAETVKSNVEIKEITDEEIAELKLQTKEISPNVEEIVLNKEVSSKIDKLVLNEGDNSKDDTLILNEVVDSKVDKVILNEEVSSKVEEISPKVEEISPKVEEITSKVEQVTGNVELSSEVALNEVKNALTNLNLNSPPLPAEAKIIQNGDSNLSDHVVTKKEVNLEADDANVSVVESVNDEVSHINEVKPILNNA